MDVSLSEAAPFEEYAQGYKVWGEILVALLCSLVHTLPLESLLCRRWGGGILGGEQPGYKIIIIISVEEEEECVHRPQEEKDHCFC